MATMKENITNALSWFYDKLKKNDLDPMQKEIDELNSDLTLQVSGSATSDFTLNSNTVNRVGNIVNLRIWSNDASVSSTGTVLATLPEEFRPSSSRYLFATLYYNNAYTTAPIIVNTGGLIYQQWTSSTITQFQIIGTYMI